MDDDIELLRLRAKAKAKAERERQGMARPEPGDGKDWGHNIFPTAGSIQGQGALPTAARAGMGTLELLDTPKRALAAMTGQGNMKDPEANIFAKPRQAWRDYVDELASDIPPEKTVKEREFWLPYPYKMGDAPKIKDKNAREAYKNALKGVGDTVFEVVEDPTLAAGILRKLGSRVMGDFGEAVVEAPRKAAGAVARGLTKIPEETLTKYATKEGRKELAMAYGKEANTAEELVEFVFKKQLPEEEIVKQFISKADHININPLVENLENFKKSIKFPKTNKAAIRKIDGLIDDYKTQGGGGLVEIHNPNNPWDYVINEVPSKKGQWRATLIKRETGEPMGHTATSSFDEAVNATLEGNLGAYIKKGKGGYVSAKEFRDMRKELDDVLGDVYEKEGLSQAQKAFKSVRKEMKEKLVKAAPPEYAEVMKEYARKMDARSEIKELLGKDMSKARDKALNLVSNVERKGADFKKMRLETFDDIYGTNFTKKAGTMHQARQIAAEPAPPGGKFQATLFPKVSTAWGVWATTAVGLGWPRTSGKILNTLTGLENAVKTGFKLPSSIVNKMDAYGGVKTAKTVQALTATLKPMSEKKVEKINKLLKARNRVKDKKMKDLYDRNITKELGGK